MLYLNFFLRRWLVVCAVSVILVCVAFSTAHAKLIIGLKQIDANPVVAAKKYQDKFLACSLFKIDGDSSQYSLTPSFSISSGGKTSCVGGGRYWIESSGKCLYDFRNADQSRSFSVSSVICAESRYLSANGEALFGARNIRRDVNDGNELRAELCDHNFFAFQEQYRDTRSNYLSSGLCLADTSKNIYTNAPFIVNANVNNKLDIMRNRLIDFLNASGIPEVVSLMYEESAPSFLHVFSFSSGGSALFNLDVNPSTLSSMQFIFGGAGFNSMQKNAGSITLKKGTSIIKTMLVTSPFITLSSQDGYNDGNYPQDGFGSYVLAGILSIDFSGLRIRLQNDTAYSMNFSAGILKSDTDPSKSAVINFKTGHPVSLLSTSPVNGSTIDLPPASILAYYDGPVAGANCKISKGLRKVVDYVSCYNNASDFKNFIVNMWSISPSLDPDTTYTLKVTGLTDGYVASDPVSFPNPFKFTTGKERCTPGTGDGAGPFVDKAKQKICKILKTSFLCQKTFGCVWDGVSTCNRQITCTYTKAALNSTDLLCARYTGDESGCGKFVSCLYTSGNCSKK